MEDYNVELVDAVRLSNVDKLKELKSLGVCMDACNKYSESVLHMAARRANYETVKFILDNGGDIGVVDDYGRTPLHDACWRNDVSFDVITALLNINLDLLRTADVREHAHYLMCGKSFGCIGVLTSSTRKRHIGITKWTRRENLTRYPAIL